MIRRTVFAAVAAGALAAPAAASAGTLNLPTTCVEQDSYFTASGSGFTPLYRVDIADDADPAHPFGAFPEEDGTFTYETRAPDYDSFTPRTVTVTVSDQVDAANNTSATYQEVRYGSNMPVDGKPGSTVTWSFAGFPTGAPIYGHFQLRNKVWRTYRFGTASGLCGTLTAKAKRLPLTKQQSRSKRKLKGPWYVQIDTNPKFSENTRPRYYKYWTVN